MKPKPRKKHALRMRDDRRTTDNRPKTLREKRKAARRATKWVQYLCPEEAS